jgi:hypothetical protein
MAGKTWMAGTSPAMTKMESISTVSRSPKILAAFSVRLSGRGDKAAMAQ